MRRTELLNHTPWNDFPERKSKEVLLKSQVVEYEGEEYLNIDLFYKGKRKGRYFADQTTHNANVQGKWYTCMLNNVARVCRGLEPMKGNLYYYSNDWEWDTPQDKKTALDYLGNYSIEAYETVLNANKYERAYRRKCQRISEMMDRVPTVPDEMDRWLEDTIFPGNYLFFKREKKRVTYHCTACGGSSWKKKGWKHNEKTICPKCGQPVIAYSRKQEIEKKAPVVLLQTMGEEYIERQMKAKCHWKAGEKKTIELYEEIRAIIPRGKTWGTVWYGTRYDADEFEQDFWDRNQLNKRWNESYLFPGTLQEVLPYGILQNSGLDRLANERIKLNVNKFITSFHARPWTEYLIKAGLTKLAAEVFNKYGRWEDPDTVRTDGQNLSDCLQLDGNRVNRMKQLNAGLNTLKWMQYEQSMEIQGKKIKISQETLEYLDKKNVEKSNCEEILEVLGSVNRMANYMKKQKIKPNSLAQTWRDYLRMAAGEGMNVEDDIVRFPKDLKARHDYLVELGNEREDKERLKGYAGLDEKIQKRLPEAARYYWENDEYMIIPAGTCEELMVEGRTLHHCVGRNDTYMKRMAAGTSWILFLRKKKNLQKPYYTIEIDMKNDNILQYYSEFDRQPDKETISELLNKFKRKIKRNHKQTRVQVPVAAIA